MLKTLAIKPYTDNHHIYQHQQKTIFKLKNEIKGYSIFFRVTEK